ncbi:hypothetical protein MB02_02290 [Croceicoccus estronivorus]|uniref:helix-turn-helix transcriptional regulator n=1 Tax=Croceicoccus estronivorus TaxID=1172626 RepID=UPI00082F29C5|nr:AraC family transcriptional regulator [Croceicoccus estronivorus]OCC25488.1 hypothetical protein MB02_02290 [Croceicoccus estronivorus]
MKHLSIPAPRLASIAVARELLWYVQRNGDDPEALVRRAGLSHPAKALLDPLWTGQLSRLEFSALYAEAVWVLDAHAARQEGRPPLTKPEFDLFCQCLISCRTLRDVIGRATTFEAMLNPRMGMLELVQDGDVAEFRMATFRTIRNISSYVSDLTGLSTHHRLFSWLIGEDIRLLAVGFRYSPLVSRECAARLMLHPVIHNAAENMFRFPAHFLERPVMRTSAELERLLERFPFDLEQILSKEAPLSERVRVVLHSALAAGQTLPTGAAIARQFHLSTATLKRRLAEEGLTLLDIKNACRGDLARALLDDGGLTVGDIAQRVGFSDSATFSRAFRQWTGHSPGAWRGRTRMVPDISIQH